MKKQKQEVKITRTDKVRKWVKRAGMYCETYWQDGKQKQAWQNS